MLNDWQVKDWEWWRKLKINISTHQQTAQYTSMFQCHWWFTVHFWKIPTHNSSCKKMFHMFYPLHVPFQTLNQFQPKAPMHTGAGTSGGSGITKAPAMLTTVFKEGQRRIHNLECNLGQKRMHESVRWHAQPKTTKTRLWQRCHTKKGGKKFWAKAKGWWQWILRLHLPLIFVPLLRSAIRTVLGTSCTKNALRDNRWASSLCSTQVR